MKEAAYDLERFVSAQNEGNTYRRAVAELSAGHKTGHWMWFVFPQVAGLGRTSTAQHYAIGSLAEAVAYAEHPVLGPRLREASRAARDAPTDDATLLLGQVDALKLRSSMTLFAAAAPEEPVFDEVLARFYDGPDPRTLALL